MCEEPRILIKSQINIVHVSSYLMLQINADGFVCGPIPRFWDLKQRMSSFFDCLCLLRNVGNFGKLMSDIHLMIPNMVRLQTRRR